jgi:hypothetical protein
LFLRWQLVELGLDLGKVLAAAGLRFILLDHSVLALQDRLPDRRDRS